MLDDQFSSMQASLRSLLRKYEERFLTMDVPPLDCPQQDKRMSDYTFETGKMTPEEYQAIHNGPDFTEVIIQTIKPSLIQWNLNTMNPLGTGQICSLNRGFLISKTST